MSKLRRKRAPPPFVRWLRLPLATVFAKTHAPSWWRFLRGPRRCQDGAHAALLGGRRVNDFAPTQVLNRTDGGVDERWISAGDGLEVIEQDLDTLPAELREALLGDRRRARTRAESATAA